MISPSGDNIPNSLLFSIVEPNFFRKLANVFSFNFFLLQNQKYLFRFPLGEPWLCRFDHILCVARTSQSLGKTKGEIYKRASVSGKVELVIVRGIGPICKLKRLDYLPLIKDSKETNK